MDTATRDELRLLRVRAYGPSADIDQDPAAMRRLHELEALTAEAPTAASGRAESSATSQQTPRVPRSATEPDPGPGAGPDPDPRPEAHGGSDQTGAGPDSGAATSSLPAAEPGGPASREGLSRRLRIVWAASLVAAAAASAGLTFSLTSLVPVAVSSGAEQIATLEPLPSTAQIPAGWFGAGPSSRTFEFYGLTLFETTFTYNGTGEGCFAVVPTEELPAEDADPNNWSISGNVFSGCRVGDFPATVEMPVGVNVPEELRSRYAVGSALQFVFDGDRIGVFLDSE